jgi:hypothetical protein
LGIWRNSLNVKSEPLISDFSISFISRVLNFWPNADNEVKYRSTNRILIGMADLRNYE